MPTEAPTYERGDALEAASVASSDVAKVTDAESSTELTEEEYWNWLLALINEGEEFDQHLDTLLDQVYQCNPRFYSVRGRKRLRTLLAELHDLREDLRAYEKDVEQLWYTFAKSEVMDTETAANADIVLESLKRTYDRAYDLCLYKFDRIADNWVTATNLLISLTILVVTILFWLEFR